MRALREWYFQVTGFGPVVHSLAWCILGRKLGTSCSKPQLLDEIYTPGFSVGREPEDDDLVILSCLCPRLPFSVWFFSWFYPSLWELHEPPAHPIILATPPPPNIQVRQLRKGFTRLHRADPTLGVRCSAVWPKPEGLRVGCKRQGARDRHVDTVVDKQGGQLLTCRAAGTRKPKPAPSTEWGGPRLENWSSAACVLPRGSSHGGR